VAGRSQHSVLEEELPFLKGCAIGWKVLAA